MTENLPYAISGMRRPGVRIQTVAKLWGGRFAESTDEIVQRLKEMKLRTAAELVDQKVGETLTYRREQECPGIGVTPIAYSSRARAMR